MKKKTNIRTVIRKIVREEVAMAIQEVITELKQPTQQVSQPQPRKKIVEKKQFTKNFLFSGNKDTSPIFVNNYDWLKNLNYISFCQFMEPIHVNSKGEKIAKNTVVIRPGKLDRSPCGTGTSARLALLRKKNK